MSFPKRLFVAGDLAPDLTGTCSSGTTPANLTGATLELHLTRPDKTVITRAGIIVDGASGTWRYEWQAGELVAGRWEVEVQVTYSNGKPQTFPADRPARFIVRAQIA